MKAKFIKAVESGDLVSIRLFISNELMLDPRGKSFSEMKSFAESKISNLYDVDDAKSYSSTQAEWNEKFLFSIKNDLDNNFSKEKLAIYENVAKYVLKEKADQLNKEETSCSQRKYSENVDRKQKKNNKKTLYGYYSWRCSCCCNRLMSFSSRSCFFWICWSNYWWHLTI